MIDKTDKTDKAIKAAILRKIVALCGTVDTGSLPVLNAGHSDATLIAWTADILASARHRLRRDNGIDIRWVGGPTINTWTHGNSNYTYYPTEYACILAALEATKPVEKPKEPAEPKERYTVHDGTIFEVLHAHALSLEEVVALLNAAPATVSGDGDGDCVTRHNEHYPLGWKHATIHLHPESGTMHSDGDHSVREWIQDRIKNAAPATVVIDAIHREARAEVRDEAAKEIEKYTPYNYDRSLRLKAAAERSNP